MQSATSMMPIPSRLEELDRQLDAFLGERQARMLVWLLNFDEVRLFEGFARQKADSADSDDAFVVCSEPFEHRNSHGIRLVQALVGADQEQQEQSEADDTYDIAWVAPALPDKVERKRGEPPPDQKYLCQALASLKEHRCGVGGRLTLCLLPEGISDVAAYARWLSELVFSMVDAEVRIAVTSERDENWCRALARAHPARVQLVSADLRMPEALLEISQAADDFEEPSGKYRHAFTQATNAVGGGDLSAARVHCDSAADIARQEGWAHLEFAAHQLFGSGALAAGDLREAFSAFESAERATHHDIRFGSSWLSPLLLQARMSKATVALTGAAWALAARIIVAEALPVARALGERRSELECQRLAAYCEERAGNVKVAEVHARAALLVGEAMPRDERRQTTLAFVGEGLLRMTNGITQRRERSAIEARMTDLLGEDWRELLQPGSASPEEMEAAAKALEASMPADAAPAMGPSGTAVIGPEGTAAIETEAALQKLLALAGMISEPTVDADAFAQLVDRTWDAREEQPADWKQAAEAPETPSASLPPSAGEENRS